MHCCLRFARAHELYIKLVRRRLGTRKWLWRIN